MRRSDLLQQLDGVLAFPMHGYFKMVTEGYRTRDAHLLQWFASLLPSNERLMVASRPEPFPRRTFSLLSRRTERELPGTIDSSPEVLAMPNLRSRKQWWIDSLRHYRLPGRLQGSAIVWNPTIALSDDIMRLVASGDALHLDLLDDWTLHAAFEGIWPELERAYARLFDAATSVSANSEGTLELAKRFGRTDAHLLPNGCDPERFDQLSLAKGPIVVGYLGKIGTRLDASLIERTARDRPEMQFWFAGPVLEREFNRLSEAAPNIRMLGDVPYRDVPRLLQSFDIGWVPHGVTSGQVGGDAIKIYEYRAAGLPVLTTPIIGTRERPMVGVTVRDGEEHSAELEIMVADRERVPRITEPIPSEMTWRHKAQAILALMGVPSQSRDDS